MRYLKAIISTILLVLVPMIMLPILQWYNKTFFRAEHGYILALFLDVYYFNDNDYTEYS